MFSVPSVSPVTAAALEHAASTTIAEHAHPWGQLAVVTRGTMAVLSEDGWWLAPPGRGIWVPPDVAHSARYSESSALIQLLLDPGLTGILPQQCRTVAVSALMRELALEAVRLVPADKGSENDARLIAQLIIREIARPQAGPKLFVPYGQDARLRRAVELLLHNPGSTTTLDELAEQAGASPRTLARLFVTETGMTFGRWREHLRITVAVERLTQGRSITQTALDLGYQSPSAFTTMFTRLLGMPPGRLLKTLG